MENVLRTNQQQLTDCDAESFYCAKHTSEMISVSPCLLSNSVFSAAGPLLLTDYSPTVWSG